MEQLKQLVYVSIISADNDEFGLTEDQKQEIISRYKEERSAKHSPSENGDNFDNLNWAYILECMPEEHKDKMIEFFNK